MPPRFSIRLSAAFLLSSLVTSYAVADHHELGVFTNHSDIGAVKIAGEGQYDATNQTYQIGGAGTNMWFGEDQCHFVWKKMSGDFVLRARAEFIGEGVDAHRKYGWMIRTSLDTGSPYVDVAIHGDGLTSMQFRRADGADTEQVESKLTAPDTFQLQRDGGTFRMSVAKTGDPLSSEELTGVDLGDEVYVGLFVCSHNADVKEQATFDNVRIVVPAPSDLQPYRDYIGSRLEILNLETGRRRVVHTTDDSMQAPNWTNDGKALIYNRNGSLYRFDLASGEPTKIDTGFADRNNNDHVISRDGTQIAISHHLDDAEGGSNVFTVPVTGGTPKRVTSTGPSYLHDWSPDGKALIYTARRNEQFDIYRISVDGGEETNLTNQPSLDDGSEYARDGKSIFFNSSRSGLMEIWQMNADGSSPKQLTDDEYNNWFPHATPDGKSLVIVSFDQSVDAEDHPFYKHVTIRHLPVDGGQPRVLAYVYGGQGTINVPSFSPDGKELAFVSNSDK